MKRNFHVFFIFAVLAFFTTLSWAEETVRDGYEIYMPYQGLERIEVNTRNYDYSSSLSLWLDTLSFSVLSSNGKEEKCKAYSSDTVIVEIPSGYSFKMSGTFFTTPYLMEDNHIFLAFYDGDKPGLNKIIPVLSNKTFVSNGNYTYKIDPIYGCGGYMSIVFKSDYVCDPTRFSFLFELKRTITTFDIKLNKASNGNVSFVENKNYVCGESVSVVATPNDGYFLESVKVIDSEGYSLPVSGGLITDNVVKFQMPQSAVSVTPEFSRTPTVNMPYRAKMTAVVPENAQSVKVYDNGGLYGNYADYSADTLVLTVPEDGYGISLSGMVSTDWASDYLYVYDGNTPKATRLFASSGKAGDTSFTQITNSGHDMTFVFKSDADRNHKGLFLTAQRYKFPVYAVKINKDPNGSILLGRDSSYQYEADTLTAIPKDGYLLKGVSIKDSDGNTIPYSLYYTWDVNKRFLASFTMPNDDVTVTPIFVSEGVSLEDGVYVDMEYKKTVNLDIPKGLESFKIYDNGGKDRRYEKNSADTLVLKAPEGYGLELTGSLLIDGSNYTNLSVYDGGSVTANRRYYGFCGGGCGKSFDIGKIYASDRYMTLCFKSGTWDPESGLDLTVNVFKRTDLHVTINQVPNGLVSTDKESYLGGETVTLNVSPLEGYTLESISVVEASGENVPVSGGWFTNNKVTFVMPKSAVTVTPKFMAKTETYINMPYANRLVAHIPQEIQSFKVYDNGGKEGGHRYTKGDTLVLIAPEGYAIKLTGTYTTEEFYEGLNSYSGKKLLKNDAGEIITIDNSLTIILKYWDSLELSVSLVPVVWPSVTLNQTPNGIVNSDVDRAQLNSIVTLSAEPDDGYMLKTVSIKDAVGNDVAFETDYAWDEQNYVTIRFAMPESDVTVTPIFTKDDISAEDGVMYAWKFGKSGRVDIPKGVQSFKLYEGGGRFGEYHDRAYRSGRLELSAPHGYGLKVTGSAYISDTYSKGSLYIRDGNNNELLYIEGFVSDIGEVFSRGRDLFFSGEYYPKSNEARPFYEGLVFTVTVVPLNQLNVTLDQVPNGLIYSNDLHAFIGDSVKITAEPNDGYIFNGVSVVETSGDTVHTLGGWFTDNKVVFTMPQNSVTVTPFFSQDYYINMPFEKTCNATIPEGVKAFKIYDAAGKNEDYVLGSVYSSVNNEQELVLTAPNGYGFKMTGSISGNQTGSSGNQIGYSSFTIYDGANTDVSVLWKKQFYNDGKSVDIGEIYSSDRDMTLYLRTSDSALSKLDLNVLVYKIPVSNILVNQVPNGQVISEKNSEQKNHEVSLLVEPAEGYFLKGISIKDAENNDVSYKTIYAWDARNRATITFTMPATDVSVTPTFADENITANDGVYVNMTYKGNDTVYIPKVVKSFKVYDNGGMSGYYRIGSADTLVLIAPENFNLKVEGRISAYNDTLYIYDGENDLENLIFKKTENYKIDEYYSIGRGLKFYFWSRSWSDGSGFDLYVTVYPNRSITLNQTPNGYLSIDKEISPVGLLRTLNVLPVEGYALKSINITDTEGKNVSYKSSAWDEHNGVTITFTMPARDVSITPVFADENITADDGAYINMTYRGNDTVFIPKAVESLKVYDNGGASEKYSANSADTLVLDAPENCILKVEGSMNSLLDSLLIFDGESDIENLLFKSKENTNYSKIGEYYSTGRRLTFYFGSRPGDVSSGFNLKVTVVPLDLFDITLKQVANGGISVRQSKALPFENVTLTAEPDEGYVFAGATATTSSGSVEVFGDWYTDNKAVFKMPQGDVVVTPKFVKKSNDLVINMPYQGKVEATITEGIDSFYVYDNGGTSYYDYNSADTLVLTAPKNKKIALFTGNSKIRINEADLLCVYDGCDTKAEVVFCGADYFSNNPSYYEKYSYYSKLSELRSSMRCLTLQFKSSTRKSYGFELGVSLVDTDPPSVTLNQVPNGIVRAEKRGDSVTVFAEPDKNYIIDKIEIRDAKGNNIWHDSTYLWNAKRSTAYSFTMPKNDVVVTPTFTDDFSNWIGNNDNPYVEPYVLMPYQGKINAVVPDYVNRLSIMSNQGPDDFYKANSADTVVLNTCVNGRIIIDDIEFWLKKGNTLSIYDGANTNSPQLFNIDSYYFAYGINLQSSTNAMTFTFKSGSVDGSPFWVNLSTECPQVEDDKLQIVIRENEGGSVSTEQKTALSGDTVTLAINVKEGYVWEDLVVKDNSSNEVPCEYTLDAESRVIATFVMPNSDVIVVPKFFNVSSLADEYYVNMKYYKWLTFDISAEQESFKVYDNGGKIFDSHADSRDTLTLTAPEGYVVLLDGTYSGTLDLHDGDNINADKFSLGNWSSGRSVTLFFYGSYKNVDLTAKVVRADLVGPHYVTVLQNSSGNVTANKEKYYKSQKVTLTAKPNKGYILKRIVVKNSQGDEIPCDMVYLWNSDKETKVTFSMPSSDVTVTPYFDYKITTKDGIYASMSKYYNRTNEINIPTEIESFKINGSFLHLSDEGNFVSTLSDDYLILVAPNGYGIKLTGSISTGAFANGSLYMYDSLFVNDYNNTKTFFAGRSEIPFVESVVGELECGNKVRLSFKTYSPVSYSPIDLTASLYQLNPYTVTVNQATHGKIVYKDGKTITNTSALGNESISWTVNLDEGYRLESVNIKGASGLDVPYTINDNWYVNKKAEISFVMPKEAVTVTPVYSSDLYIDMKYRERILTDISSNNISFNIYDHGGINGEYKENSRDTLVLKAPSGYSWKLTGSLITEASRDSLYVYNGYSPSAGLLYADCSKKNNQAEDVGEIYSSHQYMTIVFNSGASFNYDGLNLNASVVPRTRFSVKAMRSNGSLNGFNRYSATRKVYSDYELYGIFYGDTVTVEDRPDNGYHLKSVHIEDASGNEIPVSYNWVSSDNQISTKANITFVMPRNDITITPEFTDDDESYSFINMAYRKKMTVDVAVQSFKVYDNGGVNGDYNLGSRDTLVLIPPQGYGFKLTGSINTERGYDSLYVYDGTQMDNKLFVGNSEQSGKVLDIDEIYTYGSMTLRFKSDNYHNYAGLDLTVTLVKIPYTIAEIQQQQYTGKVITPALSVMYGRTLLTENTDYTLTYSNNVNTGTAQVRIKGLGDNVIDTTVTFEIVAKQTDYASVQILEDQNGTRATINADYSGKEPIYVPDAVTVDNIEIKRNLLPLTPATIVLPFQLPEGTTFNARFYYLKEVKQEGCSWTAVMKNIGSKNLPKANTPYAVILNEGEKKLEFDLHGAQATVYTDKIAENWDASDKWQFVGTYSYKVWEEGNDEIGLVYGFAGSNEKGIAQGEFGRIKVGAYAVPMRSYLKKRDSDVRIVGCAQGILAKGASHSINFSNDNTIGVEFVDGEETTAIGRMNPATGEFKIDRWYDLKGRRVNDVKRAAKGAYYGKKTFKK